jgi:hypothetical protein
VRRGAGHAVVVGTFVLGLGSGGAGGAGGAGGGGAGAGTAVPTDAAAGTATPTATATPTPDRSRNHTMDETFRVGSGEKTIEYTVTDVTTGRAIGNDVAGAEADGMFVAVEIRMTNVGDESLDISARPYRLVDGQGRSYETDSEAMVYADDAVVFEQLDPGLSKRGILIFDVPPDQSSRQLKIEPAGVFSTADPHYVRLP